VKTKLTAATRLKASLITEVQVVLRAIVQYLRDNGHAASNCRGLVNAIMTTADFADAVETLDAHRWTVVRQCEEGGRRVAYMKGGTMAVAIKETAHRVTVISVTKL